MKAVVQMIVAASVLMTTASMAQTGPQAASNKVVTSTGIKSVELKNGPLTDLYDLLATTSPAQKAPIAQKNASEVKTQDGNAEPTLIAANKSSSDSESKTKQTAN